MPISSANRLAGALFVLAASCLLSPARSGAQGGEPQYFAIRGARVVPVSGPVLENATVVVSRGLISAVGKDAAIPPEAWVIDGKGLTVYPGLIDALTDVGISVPDDGHKSRAISQGPEDRPATTPWRDAADEASLADKRIESWRSSGFTTTVSAPRDGIFPGLAAVLDLAGDRASEMVVKSPVAIPLGFKPVSSFRSFPSSLMGVLAYVHQVWIDTDWSTTAQDVYEKNPRAAERPPYDRTESVLADALDDRALVLIPATDPVQIRRALTLPSRWKVRSALYGVQSAYELAPEIAASKLPVLVDLKWPVAEKDADPDDIPSLRTLRFRDRAPSTPAALEKAGVKFAFYSGGIAAPKDIFKAIEKAVDAGLPREAALRALTLSPAEIYGVSDRLGSIEPGKIANLVVADGDLFAEKTKIKYVFVDGEEFEQREPEKPGEPPKGDISGHWTIAYTSQDRALQATADLIMAKDGSLSGSLVTPQGTSAILSGHVTGNKFSLVINLILDSGPADITLQGAFEGNALKGSADVQGSAVDFTGTRPAPQLAANLALQGDAR